jgi:actin-related protein
VCRGGGVQVPPGTRWKSGRGTYLVLRIVNSELTVPSPLIDVPDHQLNEEDLKEKRRQKLMKAGYDARIRLNPQPLQPPRKVILPQFLVAPPLILDPPPLLVLFRHALQEAPSFPLIDVPDHQLNEEDLKEKRRQKLMIRFRPGQDGSPEGALTLFSESSIPSSRFRALVKLRN